MSRRILIVDPNEAFATMLCQGLGEMKGTKADVVASSDKALQAVAAAQYDLLIVDMGLPEQASFDLVRTFRQEYPNLPMIIMPLNGDLIPDELAGMDFQGVLSKPFFLPELPDKIEAALSLASGGKPKPAPAATTSRSAPATASRSAPPPATDRASRPAAESATLAPASYERLADAVRLMSTLAEEVGAESVLLTRNGELLAYAGWLPEEEIAALSTVISESWRNSARVAEILGKEQVRFEQSIEGEQHLLYSMALTHDLVLSVVVGEKVALGMIRHRAKETAEAIRELVGA